MKTLLFISHDASRTGAPIVLLNFLQWLKRQGGYQFCIFLKNGGELAESFKELGDTYLPERKTLPQRLSKRVFKTPEADTPTLPAALLKKTFDLVYLNTVVCLDLAPVVKVAFNCPVICHIHENDFTIKYYYPGVVNEANLTKVDHFIAASESTRINLSGQYNLPPESISLVYEFINLKEVKKPSVNTLDIKQELGLGDELIIGGSGLTIWRKGADLFVQLALEINRLKPGNNIKLVWVGALTHEFACQYAYEAGRLGIADKIIFTGAKASPQNYFQLFDVFVLTSREDPFPLVALEAASLNKPVVCFEDAGGMPELISHGQNGLLVPYGDVKQMAVEVLALLDNQGLRSAIGTNAGKLIADFDVEIAAPKILQLIEQLAGGGYA